MTVHASTPNVKEARNKEIVSAIRSGESQRKVARRYGITRQRVQQIVARATQHKSVDRGETE